MTILNQFVENKKDTENMLQLQENKIAIANECVLEYIYKKSPIEIVSNKNIAEFRIELGKSLFSEIPPSIVNDADAVVPCPQTGIYYAIGLALAINKQYLPAIVNLSPNERYLSVTDPDERKKFIWSKLYPIKSLVENKKVIIVDEAIFTGMTLKILCEMLNTFNAKAIYLCIPTPMCLQKCLHNIMPQKNILLENIRAEMLKEYFNVDAVIFQDFKNFSSVISKYFPNTCLDCFTVER